MIKWANLYSYTKGEYVSEVFPRTANSGFFPAALFTMSSRWQCDLMENAGPAFSEFPSLVKKVLWVKDGWEKVLLKFSSPKISLS